MNGHLQAGAFRLQVEGGFVQGMGWTCLEELVWGDEDHKWLPPGVLHTRGPGKHLPFPWETVLQLPCLLCL